MSEIIYIPLQQAFLCCDCQAISNNAVRCPACASEHGLMSLASVMDREQPIDLPEPRHGEHDCFTADEWDALERAMNPF